MPAVAVERAEPVDVKGRTVLPAEPPETPRPAVAVRAPEPEALAALELLSPALAAVAAVGRVREVWRTRAAEAVGAPAAEAADVGALVTVVLDEFLAAADAVGRVRVERRARTPVAGAPVELVVEGFDLVDAAEDATADALARSVAVALDASVDPRPNRPTMDERLDAVVEAAGVSLAGTTGLVEVEEEVTRAAAGRPGLVVVLVVGRAEVVVGLEGMTAALSFSLSLSEVLGEWAIRRQLGPPSEARQQHLSGGNTPGMIVI